MKNNEADPEGTAPGVRAGKDNPLLVAAGRFHGHIGPFLALGLRMGLIANELLGRAPMYVGAVVRVEPRPPRSCVVDGIQYSTGCTMGKRNIRIEPESAEVSVRFTKGASHLTIGIRQAYLDRMERELDGVPEKAVIDYSFKIMDTPPEEMFEVSE
jgi:formylmethanofuran dehydrogenase subunit E